MKRASQIKLVVCFFCFCYANISLAGEGDKRTKHDLWLKQKFSQQHQQLIPVVAVADMLSACNLERKVDPVNYQVKDLIKRMSRELLAQKLSQCLGDDSPKSDLALNYGLLGCFREQLSELSAEDKKQKMKLVKRAIASLSREERQKSLTKCVTNQSMNYLK